MQRRASKPFYIKSANRKSANFWPHSCIANPQISKFCQSANQNICKFLQNTVQLCVKTVLKVDFLHDFKLKESFICIFVRRKGMYLRTCGSCKSQKQLGPQSQICKVSHLRMGRKSNKLFKCAGLKFLLSILSHF